MDLSDTHPSGAYHPSQLVAHWTILALLVVQFATGGAMEAAFTTAYRGLMPLGLSGEAWVHGIIGTTILALMLWRVYLRRTYGAPPPPDTEPSAVQKLSRGVHYAFYVFLIAMPLAGMLATLTLSPLIGQLHGIASKILLALIALHVAGALWHAFKKDGVAKRMVRADPSGFGRAKD